MATTLEQLTDRVYEILNLPVDHPSATLTFVEGLCNDMQFLITKGMKFPFLEATYLFRTKEDTTLSGDITTASTTITVPTGTILSSESYIMIDNDLIKYTGVTTGDPDTLTGVTGVGISHSAGDDVRQLYAIPTDYSHDGDLVVDDNLLEYVHNIDDTDDRFISARWSIVQTSDGEMFQIHDVEDDEKAYFKYYKIPPDMTDLVDCTIPDRWAIQVIPPAVAGEIKQYKHQEQRGQLLLNSAERAKQLMRAFYGMRNKGQKPRITFGRYGSRLNI